MSKHFVITGDRGFVGSRMRSQLLARGDQVLGIDQSPSTTGPVLGYRPLTLDLSDRETVAKHAEAFRAAEAVIHLAGRIPQSDDEPLEWHLKANLRTTENLLEVLDSSGVPLILSSTMYVYGLEPGSLPVSEQQIPRPTSPYGLTKLAAECTAERMARAGRVPCVALRYVGIFGVGSDVALELYASKALSGETVSVYGGGTIVRDYVHVDDVVAANLLAVEAAPRLGWGLYHVGGGEALRLVDIAQLTAEAVGHADVETNDRPGPFDFAFDISRARADLGYNPPPMKKRIAQYVEEFRQARHGLR